MGRARTVILAVALVGIQALPPIISVIVSQTNNAQAAQLCAVDSQGANDEPGQKDLTRLCIDKANSPTSYDVLWNWDEIGTSGANTLDACALFDTDSDGNINYAVCVTTQNNPATLQSYGIYSCGDGKVDRCTSTSSLISSPYSTTCSVSQQATQPFASGANTPNDTVANCTIVLSEVGGTVANLVDVCSFPSQNPNSDPSDCVIIAPGKGKLEVQKIIDPTDDPGLFNLIINGTTYAPNVGSGGTTGEVVVDETDNNNSNVASETAGTSTTLNDYTTSIECRDLNGTGNVIASGNLNDPTNRQITVPVADASDVVCVLTNTRIGATLTVTKTVSNDNGGTLGVSDFPLFIDGNAVTSGQPNTVTPGAHTVSETNQAGYAAGDWGGDCAADGSITLSSRQSANCTITNDDQQAYIIVNKTVNNDNGGNAQPNDFLLTVDGNTVSDETAHAVNPGAHTAGETNLPGYAAGTWGGDCDEDGDVSVALGETKTCTITNDDIAPKITVTKTVVNDNGGTLEVSDFPLFVDALSVVSGAQNTLDAGSYSVSETNQIGYAAGNWGGDCDSSGAITLQIGGTYNCTITNDDDAPSLTLVKEVTNDNGGQAAATDWTLSADGPTPISGAGGATSDANFDAGTYTLSESSGPGGYTASDWVCVGGQQNGNQITIALGEDVTCTITNDDDAPSLGLTKVVVNDNGGEAKATMWTVTADGPSFVSGPGSAAMSDSLIAGIYELSESGGPDGYASEGWQCEGGILVGSTLTIDLGEDVTCTIINNDEPSTVIVTKYHDQNENGIFDEGEPTLEGWDINLGEATQTTGADGTTTFNDVPAGGIGLAENLQEGWQQSGNICNEVEGSLDGNVYFFTIGNGQTINCFIGNHQNPVLNITKFNDKPAPTFAGDTVTYTIVVTVPENSGRVYGQFGSEYVPVTVTDVPPDNFTYVLGSWTADSSERGDLKAAGITTEPTYASPGVWILTSPASNFLVPGEVVTLTYQATIGASVPPGTYPDSAFVQAFTSPDEGGPSLLGIALGTCNAIDEFAKSCVSIEAGQVLGDSTTVSPGNVLALVDTGTPVSTLQIIVPALLISITFGVGIATRRSYAKK